LRSGVRSAVLSSSETSTCSERILHPGAT
jgi:hypothetical protein